jgi:hypothetical protein
MANTTNGTAIAIVASQGTGQGYYKEKGGFLSDQKKLFDGYYYQDFSYDVISSLQLEKYKDILKKVVHTAGFIAFGTLEYITVKETANCQVVGASISTMFSDIHGDDTLLDDSSVQDRFGNFVLSRANSFVISPESTLEMVIDRNQKQLLTRADSKVVAR